jgi:predicted ATPase
VLSVLAQSTGVRAGGSRPLAEQLTAQLRAKRLLLVLDNFEHLLAAAPELATLLEACPQLTVLATSRARLRMRGERARAGVDLTLDRRKS